MAQTATPEDQVGDSTAQESREALDQFDPAMIFELGLRSPEITMALDSILEALFSKGEPETGWAAKGVSFEEAMDDFESENGSAFYLELDEDLPFVASRQGPVDLLGEGWEKHRIFESNAQGRPEFGLTQLAPGIWLEFATGSRYIDKAQCSAGIAHIDLATNKPLSSWSDEKLGLAILLYGMFKRIADADVCSVYERQKDGALMSFAYDSEGRPFNELNKSAAAGQIVTRAEALAAIGSLRSR